MELYKKLLVISDNPYLIGRFVQEVIPLLLYPHRITFKCSPYSNPALFDGVKIDKIDLKIDDAVEQILEDNYDVILSIHCKQLFPEKLIKHIRCINVHPGYNPINRGWYPQVFSIIYNLPIGATIHEIDEKLDHGHILDRSLVQKYENDTSLTLYNRVVDKEIELLKKNINAILNLTYSKIKPEKDGNLFLKSDFNALCALNLEEKLTMGQAINKLRALSHGNFKNAYFYNNKGEKIYVSINLSDEQNN